MSMSRQWPVMTAQTIEEVRAAGAALAEALGGA